MSSPPGHPGPKLPPKRVLLLNYLLRIREDMLKGRLGMHIGDPDVAHMVGFVNGYHSCMLSNGIEDEEYGRFFDWLREKGEYPPEGWAAKYLRDCNGDHAQAIRKYLDFVYEFVTHHRS
jgi:hypothetical protein